MGKDTRLVNIYLKIHNKRPLMLDDLKYLAEYAPECFEKTCQNVVYNIPEAKPIMKPVEQQKPEMGQQPMGQKTQEKEITLQVSEQLNIEQVLANLKRLEMDEFPVADIDVDKVKNLLGNLYMELLFPHNDKDTFMNMANSENRSLFDKKA